MKRRAGLVPEILVFPTEISVTGLESFPYEHVSPVTGMKKKQIHTRFCVEGEQSSLAVSIISAFFKTFLLQK